MRSTSKILFTVLAALGLVLGLGTVGAQAAPGAIMPHTSALAAMPQANGIPSQPKRPFSSATNGRKHYNFSCSKAGGAVTYSGALDVTQDYSGTRIYFSLPTVSWTTSPPAHADRWDFRMRNQDDERTPLISLGGTIGTPNDVDTYGDASDSSAPSGWLSSTDTSIWAYMAVWDNGGTTTQCTDAVLAK
jgi:hypothetical protein